ncbi:MAG: caspase family protein [Panacibacter sp.]
MNGITYIIAIGIENYHEGSLAKVSYAEKDASKFVDAFTGLGYDKDNCMLLVNDRATKTTILNNLSKVADRSAEGDRIIFYFAGHGFSINGINMLAPVDAAFDSLDTTCISINDVLDSIQKSNSKRNILFLDSCHSGFQQLGNIRDATNLFSGDSLEYDFRDIEYCVGFASCKSNQKSYSHTSIQNGVWSYFLINALKGKAENLTYEGGCLMSDKLQAYLRINTQEYVKKNIKKDQTPIEFGNKMDKFIVANLNPLLEAIEASKQAPNLNLTSISIYNLEEKGKIKNLDGFIKNYHSLPAKVGDYEDRFIKSISNNVIDNEIASLSGKIQKKFNYKRIEMKIHKEAGLGSIETPDFYYSITVSQSQTFPDQYEVRRSLDYIKNNEIIHDILLVLVSILIKKLIL